MLLLLLQLLDGHINILLEGITECHDVSSVLAVLLQFVFDSSSHDTLQKWCHDMGGAHMNTLVMAVRASVMKMLEMEGLTEKQQANYTAGCMPGFVCAWTVRCCHQTTHCCAVVSCCNPFASV